MEKLQKALQKARSERDTLQPGAKSSPADTGDDAATGTAVMRMANSNELWQELIPWAPKEKSLEKGRLVTGTANPASAPFDILRTKILLTMRKNGWTRLAVTSATPNCGKSFVAANLALGCARNTDMRAILMELDLSDPDLARMLKLPDTAELAPMLDGRIPFARQALRYRNNVAIAVPRKPTPDPTSILLNRNTNDIISQIQNDYAPDLIIFDLPPVLTSDETRAVLKDMDCAIIIAKAGASTLNQVDNCEREVADHTNVLGVVLNECRDGSDLGG